MVVRWALENPSTSTSRDRGRVIGQAKGATEVTRLEEPVTLAGRSFTSGCEIRIAALCPSRSGLELAPIVHELQTFPDSASWSVRMRTPLLRLDDHDAVRLIRELSLLTENPDAVRGEYLDRLPA